MIEKILKAILFLLSDMMLLLFLILTICYAFDIDIDLSLLQLLSIPLSIEGIGIWLCNLYSKWNK